MTDFMSNDQIISAAKNDIDKHLDNGTFYGDQTPNHDGNWENFFTITSCYAQWAKDKTEAEEELWKMYEEDYPQYFMYEVTR